MTAVGVGIIGLVVTVVFGLSGFDVSRHISFGIFSTMVTLLAHSMMMFYLIGKGKAVKDAMVEGGLQGNFYSRIARARKPVFSSGTLAMAVTIVAAVLGASADTGALPVIVHGMIAWTIAGNAPVSTLAPRTAATMVTDIASVPLENTGLRARAIRL